MINIEAYICQLTESLKKHFQNRLCYIGLQGSYLREEATEHSDIDMMVVVDNLSVEDMDVYRTVIQSMEHYDKSCGFICSKSDLANWNHLEICHLLHSTKDYYGKLQDLVPAYTNEDVRNFVKLSVNNLYHEICHRYIHADFDANKEKLPFTYKGVFFILQNLYFLEHEEFIATKAELLLLLQGKNRTVLERAMALNDGKTYDFAESFSLLFSWCQETLEAVS